GSAPATGRTPTADTYWVALRRHCGAGSRSGERLPTRRGHQHKGGGGRHRTAGYTAHPGTSHLPPLETDDGAAVSRVRQPNARAASSIRPVAKKTDRPAHARTEPGLTPGSDRRPAAVRILARAVAAEACIAVGDRPA